MLAGDQINQHGVSFQATLAECHEQLGDWSAAASAWQRVASSPKAASEGRERAAEALYRAGRYEDAIPLLLELVQEAPPETSGPPHLMLAECYFAVGRPTAARAHLQAVLRRDAEQVSALRMLARSFAEGGDWAAALRIAQPATAVDGQDPRTLELVAGLAWRAGECDLATSAAARLLTLEPENPVAQYVLRPDH